MRNINTRLEKLEKVLGMQGPELPIIIVRFVDSVKWTDLSDEQKRQTNQRIKSEIDKQKKGGKTLIMVHDVPRDYEEVVCG